MAWTPTGTKFTPSQADDLRAVSLAMALSLLRAVEKSFPKPALYSDSGSRYAFTRFEAAMTPRPQGLCVMAPTQSSNSSFSWGTLKEARKRLFFL
jgi:hypothetical protein